MLNSSPYEASIFIYGHAVNSLSSLHLDDFVIAFSNTWMKFAKISGSTHYYSLPGCSIDPDPYTLSLLNEQARRLFSSASPEAMQSAIEKITSGPVRCQSRLK